MTIRYRTTDLARWGTGTGADLSAEFIDENFWTIDVRLAAVEDLPPAAAGIDRFEIQGDQLTVVMDDLTTRGPYTLPAVPLVFREDWAPSTVYAVNDIFQHGGSVYVVQVAHTSDLTFDPNRVIGAGTDAADVYALAFTVDGVLPTGGTTGMWLRKTSGVDFEVAWAAAPIPIGGTVGQILVKNSSTDYDTLWSNLILTVGDASDVEAVDDVEGAILRFRSGEYKKEQPSAPQVVATTTLTLTETYMHRFNLCTAGAGCDITVPAEADWDSLVAGMEFHFRQSAAGPVEFIEGATDVSINGVDGFLNSTGAQGAVATLIYGGSDVWYLYGHLAAV